MIIQIVHITYRMNLSRIDIKPHYLARSYELICFRFAVMGQAPYPDSLFLLGFVQQVPSTIPIAARDWLLLQRDA